MTKDVIELAREAGLSHRNLHSGLEHCNLDDDEDLTPALVKFAALVAARERERIAAWIEPQRNTMYQQLVMNSLSLSAPSIPKDLTPLWRRKENQNEHTTHYQR